MFFAFRRPARFVKYTGFFSLASFWASATPKAGHDTGAVKAVWVASVEPATRVQIVTTFVRVRVGDVIWRL